jgi:glucose-1-phosphate thymidylyltransferase
VSATRRALILARGLGRRMREAAPDLELEATQRAAADAGMKAMIPFGRPFLDFVLHTLADAGVTDAALVLGPEHEQVREYYRQLHTSRIVVAFVEQARPLGTADAVLSGREWAGQGSFLVLNADNLYPVDVLRMLVNGTDPALPGFERDSLEMPLERVGTFALLECAVTSRDQGSGNRDGKLVLTGIREKPGLEMVRAAGPHALISMNVWRFDERIFDACRDVPLSSRGERELPQAVGLAVSRGVRFEVVPVRGTVLDLSKREDIPRVATALQGMTISL